MVAIPHPPPVLKPEPVLHKVVPGANLLRIYNPGRRNAAAPSFRHTGPISRFDHHRESASPVNDLKRGILYGAWTIRGCLVEIFGDTKIVQVGEYEVARLTITRELKLLDLRGGNAHNDEDAVALYERAEDGIACGAGETSPLRDDALRFEVQMCATESRMFVEPY